MASVLFTTNNLPLAYCIRGITGEPVSHCAVLVSKKYVLHSDLYGVKFVPYEEFISKHKIIYKVDLPTNRFPNMKNLVGAKYDYMALVYLGLRYMFPSIMPKQNLWQTSGMFLCTEFVTKLVENNENSMITPYQLYLQLNERYPK